MIEILILLGIALLLLGLELGVYRALRGPAQGRRGTIRRALLLGLVTVPLLLGATWQISKSRTFQLLGETVARVAVSEPVVALTFDDGPTPGFTEAILTILRENDAPATFFVTGQALEENLEQAEWIVAEGHELGNHSYSHARMVGRSYAFVRQEIEQTDALIRTAGHTGPIHFRPPYCKRLIILPTYLSTTGRTTILMDVEPESYPEIAATSAGITRHVLDNTQPGSIILLHVMHPSRGETMRAIPGIIQGLQNKGYRFVTISELLTLQE